MNQRCNLGEFPDYEIKINFIIRSALSSSMLLLPNTSEAKLPVAVDGQQLPTLAPMLERVTHPVS